MSYNRTWHMLYNITWHMLCNITWHMLYNMTWECYITWHETCSRTYTCQLFLSYKHETFILGVLGFLHTTRSFPKISEVVRSLPKVTIEKTLIHKIRDREEGIVIYSFYTWFSFLTWVWVNIFLEIVSSKTATTHIFQSGVRNWPAGVSRREIEVFNPQAWDSRLRRESWQVYITWHETCYNITRHMLYNITGHMLYNITWHYIGYIT